MLQKTEEANKDNLMPKDSSDSKRLSITTLSIILAGATAIAVFIGIFQIDNQYASLSKRSESLNQIYYDTVRSALNLSSLMETGNTKNIGIDKFEIINLTRRTLQLIKDKKLNQSMKTESVVNKMIDTKLRAYYLLLLDLEKTVSSFQNKESSNIRPFLLNINTLYAKLNLVNIEIDKLFRIDYENQLWKKQVYAYFILITGVLSILIWCGVLFLFQKRQRFLPSSENLQEDKEARFLEKITQSFLVTDQEGVITYVNNHFILNIHNGEVIGQKIYNFFQQEDRKKISKIITIAAHEKKEGVFKGKFQAYNDQNLWFFCNVSPHREGRNIIISFCSISDFENASIKQKKVDKLEKVQQQFLHNLIISAFDAMPIEIFLLDQKGKFLLCNKKACEILGISKESIINKTVYDLFPTSIADSMTKRDQKKASFRIISTQENQAHKFGKNRTVFSGKTLLKIKNIDSDLLLNFAFDISNRKALESQLQQTNKMESMATLAGGIAHDFNNLLFAMMLNIKLAIRNLSQEDQQYSFLSQTLLAGDRAKKLINQILIFSRRDKHELHSMQVSSILKESLELVRTTLPKNVKIQKNINNQCGPILADGTQFHQVVMNLCTNAGYAMIHNGGTLFIDLKEINADTPFVNLAHSETGKWLNLTVSDTGHGIDSKILDRIYDPFFTTKPTGEGSGMGLAVVHGIIDHFGGLIHVSSEENHGTTFEIYFPLLDKQQLPDIKKINYSTPKGVGNILLVDDEKLLVEAQKKLLETFGYTVEATTSPIQALEIIQRSLNDFDVVITDQTMPKLSGIELAIKLRHSKPKLPVILVSGFSASISEKALDDAGIQYFLQKPFSNLDLTRCIDNIMSRN